MKLALLVAALLSGGGLGPELITNGDFSAWTGGNPDGWTVTEDATDTVTQDGANNIVVLTDGGSIGNGPQIAQTLSLDTSATYRYTIIVSAAGVFQFRNSGTVIATISSVGTHTGTFQVANNFINLLGTSGVSKIDSVSIQQVL
jgi:hypothetical protein